MNKPTGRQRPSTRPTRAGIPCRQILGLHDEACAAHASAAEAAFRPPPTFSAWRSATAFLVPYGWEHSEDRPGLRRTYEACERALHTDGRDDV